MTSYFLILDLEATCSNDGGIPSEEMEMIEIGAVMLNRSTWEIDAEYQKFIKPVRHPKLTEFCTELTTITQQDVDTAPTFPEVIPYFKQWVDSYPNHIFCSWGNYDKKQFIQDCEFHHLDYPFGAEHRNIKKEFSLYIGDNKKRFGMAEALQHLEIELQGTHHRGIDDARNIAAIYKYMNKVKGQS
ncbi:3'-5' exonuclease [Rivularia sp. UHCC 0363]|uniref:3'-5' exonuclease n=1 Tax=Rivularia sp. UHCC 0363 TaxID=3110244 RepID=UPI002B1F4E0A|nr:3'-5' exonuclease [Rivularia sp. UHCC 0363]MEA5597299.1 3'-5' exonuclease [Rivularia sp. UHCC 0363]